jgi:L-lactate utilization protein LutC
MYENIPNESVINKTVDSLKERGFLPEVLETKTEALEKIKTLIPAGSSVMNGSSVTLQEIGFVDFLKEGNHGWNNLHAGILAETDKAKQGVLRKQSVISDFYLGSVHALSENGEMVIASASGSQLPEIVFTSQNLIFVVGVQKIAENLDQALKRVREHVVPLEDNRMKSVGMGGTMLSKILILEKEPAFMGRKVHILIVKEKLGF